MAEEYIASSGIASDVSTKKRGRKSIKTDMKDWSDDEIFSLIDEWATKEEPFNNSNALYHNKEARAKALGIICRSLEEIDIIASAKQIQEKITNLRNYYAVE